MEHDWINEGVDPEEDIDPFDALVSWLAAQFRGGQALTISALAQRAHATREDTSDGALYDAMVALSAALDEEMIAADAHEYVSDEAINIVDLFGEE